MVWPQLSVTPVIPLGGGSNATESFAVRGPDPTETARRPRRSSDEQRKHGRLRSFAARSGGVARSPSRSTGSRRRRSIGPNTIGGGINIVTLEPTIAPHFAAAHLRRLVRHVRRDDANDRNGRTVSATRSRCIRPSSDRIRQSERSSRRRRAALRPGDDARAFDKEPT